MPNDRSSSFSCAGVKRVRCLFCFAGLSAPDSAAAAAAAGTCWSRPPATPGPGPADAFSAAELPDVEEENLPASAALGDVATTGIWVQFAGKVVADVEEE